MALTLIAIFQARRAKRDFGYSVPALGQHGNYCGIGYCVKAVVCEWSAAHPCPLSDLGHVHWHRAGMLVRLILALGLAEVGIWLFTYSLHQQLAAHAYSGQLLKNCFPRVFA
jgi:hypothetical protein